ncbi:MAG: type VI secretion system baseplate subunit TssE [Arenicellales bacterium]
MTKPSLSLLGELLGDDSKQVDLFDDVQRNLGQILNNLPALIDLEGQSSIIGQSMLDFGNVSTSYHGNREALVARLQHAVERFEPRLEEVSVQLYGAQQNGSVLRVGLTARLNLDGFLTDVFFGANLEQNGSWAKLTESELG